MSANLPARRLLDVSQSDIGRPLKDLDISYKPIDLRTPIENADRDRRALTSSQATRARSRPGWTSRSEM